MFQCPVQSLPLRVVEYRTVDVRMPKAVHTYGQNGQRMSQTQQGFYLRVTYLPGHDQPTTNHSRRNLGSVNRYRDLLEAHTNTEQNTGDDQLLPSLSHSHADWREHGENSGDEYNPSSAEPMVQRVRSPTRAMEVVST